MENIDETQETEDAHPLVLPYFKCHRGVLEAFSEHDVSAPAQRFYLYLCHNSLVHHGIFHKLDIVEIANYFSKTPRRVYSWIGELEDAALIKVKSHGSVVAELHFLRLAQNSAKAPVSDLLFHKSIVKGGEVSRAVPVNSDGRDAICVLMDYQLLRFGEVSGDRWLFPSRLACGNKPLHRQTAHNALKRAFIAAGLNGKLAMHSLA